MMLTTSQELRAAYIAPAYYDSGLGFTNPLLADLDLPWRAKSRVAAALAERADQYATARSPKPSRWPKYVREKRLSDVARLTQTQLLRQRNFGMVCLAQVQEVLRKHGFAELKP